MVREVHKDPRKRPGIQPDILGGKGVGGMESLDYLRRLIIEGERDPEGTRLPKGQTLESLRELLERMEKRYADDAYRELRKKK